MLNYAQKTPLIIHNTSYNKNLLFLQLYDFSLRGL